MIVRGAPLQYAAALAIAAIDPAEGSGVNILETILLEETDKILRENTISALKKIGSPDALLVTTHVEFEDKQARYARTCLYSPYLPMGGENLKSISLLLKASENPDVRLSASETFDLMVINNSSLSEIQFAFSELTSILKNRSSQYKNHPVLQNIFRLKGQDIRRGKIYALGAIGAELKKISNRPNQQRNSYPQIQREIVTTLMAIVTDREEDLDIRWMAAASLQKLKVDVDWFFSKEQLINPAVAIAQSRWISTHAKLFIYSFSC